MAAPRLTASHLVHLAAVPLLILLERFAYYATRSVLTQWFLFGVGLSDLEMVDVYGWLMFGFGTSPILGALVVVALGPYWAGLLGGLTCALGVGLLIGIEGPGWLVGMSLLVAGQGLIRPALWTLLAVQLTGHRELGRVALFAAAYFAVNVGAAAGGYSGFLSDQYGFFPFFAGSAAVFTFTALVLPALWLLGRNQEWPTPSLEQSLPVTGRAVGVLVLTVPFWTLVTLGSSASVQVLMNQATVVGSSTFYTANLVGLTAMALLLVPLMTGAQLADLRFPSLVLAGVGLMAAGLGSVGVLPSLSGVLGMSGLVVTTLALAASEGVALPVAMASILGDTHWRVVPLLVGLWSAASWLTSWIGQWLETAVGQEVALGASAVAVSACGVGLVAIGVLTRQLIGSSATAATDP